MNCEEIKNIARKGNGTIDFELYSEAFDSNITQNIYIPTLNWKTGEQEENIDNLITPYISDCVNSFLKLEKLDFIEKLKNELFRLFNIYIEVTDYGQVPDDLRDKHGNTKANRIFFEGNDKDRIYENCRFESVFYDNSTNPELIFSISIGIDWDLEHGINLFFENGELINIEGS